MTILNSDHPFQINGLHPARCLEPEPPRRERVYAVLVPAGKKAMRTLYLREACVSRAAGYGVLRLYRGATAVAAHAKNDTALLAGTGHDEVWRGGLQQNAELLYDLWLLQQGGEAQLSLSRQRERTPEEEVDERLREALLLVRSGNLEWAIDILHRDRKSTDDRQWALGQFNARAADPKVRAKLIGRGLTEEGLLRLVELQGLLRQETRRRAEAGAQLAVTNVPLSIVKGVVYGDMVMLAGAVRAKMPETRWEYYQLGTVLDLPERTRSSEEPAPDPEEPVVGGPALPSAGGAGAATGAASGTGAATATGGAFRWPSGTVVYTVPVDGGPSLSAVAREDGTLAWTTTVTSGAATTPPLPTPPAVAAPAPAPAPAPARRSRRRTPRS